MTPAAHAAYTAAVRARLEADPDVLGLVGLGSTSGLPPGPDEHSDHDLFVVTRAGVQERFRNDLSWLPDAGEIVLGFRETAHGVKALYASGHLVELAVFDPDELAVARVNRYRVLLDRADVEARMARVRAATVAAAAPPDGRWHAGQLLTLLVVGAARAARGERLSAHQCVRVHAFGHLLALLAPRVAEDDLDPSRRFERARPELGRELDAALAQPIEAAARALLEIAARELPALIPAAARAAVERALSRRSSK